MRKNIKKSVKEKFIKICKLCGIDFDVWASNMHIPQEKEERMRRAVMKKCLPCKCSAACST
ncbi:MAG: hypothetical protein A2528_01405 [Candidatus Staskawiczbacteria bacterium RIFOXYD2_FULL_37_9]|uniref:Uncharacterized protein n=1 Tax=Candidatus Staskawiczbacteria bacterium RIFOXYB1_FULL_37_44 TaxID=1802223 RepID=A0A1G2IX45_9BACT|nr:MAG: hypothetical protein A2358_03300 [Candidatus Staskawiczbacteria bacterium RIFOXYB1_FULL_37_44]OGZ84188.1 MAG: hypothetical protein A2416_00900 [Candidatus Staskawiczbacteria bacterium RIFOXYC1_FULL_37_52]OGZ88102.1 MAG: hypothetical protein A2444_00065 [Candidatus Staskawiczbacteria bacterium RIFOXYC2_FULL_37_19]OGZ89251.1 MAG: hypothetical protein A2581_04145 [Candidatus Staskawiczbacteria bacterium RIFOXYD1_FULL_37_110]OGZ94106.1 MAG: hypothetical protein A2528_01405 [Candidatus Stask